LKAGVWKEGAGKFTIECWACQDIILVSPEKLENYEAKIKSFYEEHIHTDEEVRYCLDGSGQFTFPSCLVLLTSRLVLLSRLYLAFLPCPFGTHLRVSMPNILASLFPSHLLTGAEIPILIVGFFSQEVKFFD
jgi:hypothetical protein